MFEVRKTSLASMAMVAVMVTLAAGSARAEDKRIAVVNVSDVFARYDKVKSVQDALQKEYEPDQKSLQTKERDLKTWKERIEAEAQIKDPKTDPKLFAEQLKFQQAGFDFQVEYTELLKKVEDRRKTEMKGVLQDIRRAIADISKLEKYELVLRAPEYTGDFDPNKAAGSAAANAASEADSAAELVRRFRDNPVLYFASGVDITEKVIAKLNTDFKANGVK